MDLKKRTKEFGLKIIKLYSSLPQGNVAQVIGKQLLRSGTSVGAQYREAYRSRSDSEYISKIKSITQELDESIYWMELLIEAKIIKEEIISDLMKEADEFLSIFVTSAKNVKNRKIK